MSYTTTSALHFGSMITGLVGGLAMFLYGMRKMTDALKTVAGSGMKDVLAKITTNRFTGVFSGALITSIIQSSSVTTVLVVGFITAGLMSFSQSIGVIIGANIGTTITAQIIAFKVTKYALVFISAGFLIEIASKNRKIRYYGIILMGLGLLFYGMELMSDATNPLRSYQPFINLMQQMRNPIFGILVGMLFTALVQSSSATTGIVIVLAGQGFITLEAGIALIFGANVGTCVTALLSAIGKPLEAKRAAMVHVIFNVLGVCIWLVFIPQLADFVRMVSPASAAVDAAVKLSEESPRQIANAHTIFNIANAILFIWFTKPLAHLIEFMRPGRQEPDTESIKPLHINDIFLTQPALALDHVRLELNRLGELSKQMVNDTMGVVIEGSEEQLSILYQMDRKIDDLHGAIISYLGKLSMQDLSERQSNQIYILISAANYIESVGDVVETNLVADGKKRCEEGLTVSELTRQRLEPIHEKVCWSVETAIQALVTNDIAKAEAVLQSKQELNAIIENTRVHLMQRLVAEEPDRLEVFRMENNILDSFKRIHTLSRKISKVVAHQ
jgi:phosphate:Na+ symporter